jgi:Icc protein
VPAPFLVAQISDIHVGGDWGPVNPVAGARTVIEAVLALPDTPDAVVVSGDLVEHGSAAEYDIVHELLCALPAPVHVLAGNHDDRGGLRARFALPGHGAAPIQYAVDLGPLRLVVLDTTIPGHPGGELDAARLTWLDAELARAPRQPTLLAMHHPPAATGIAPWDAIGLAPDHRRKLEQVIERHPQVRRMVAGHIHQPCVAALAGRPVLAIPSTYVQARIDFSSPEIQLAPGPAGFAVHALVDGDISSFVHTLG